MKAWEFNAVTYDGDVYCAGCLPEGVALDDEGVSPLFASDEWDGPAFCEHCGEEHDYMSLSEAGLPDEPDEDEPDEPDEDEPDEPDEDEPDEPDEDEPDEPDEDEPVEPGED